MVKATKGATTVLALIVMPPKRRGLKLISDKRLPFSGWGDMTVRQGFALHTVKLEQDINSQDGLLSDISIRLASSPDLTVNEFAGRFLYTKAGSAAFVK